MKQKIIDALKQKYANLGLGDEVFERVASSVETFVNDEGLASFVTGAEGLLKQYQSIGDRARTERDNAKREAEELKTKLAALEGKEKDKDITTPPADMAEIIKKAISEATAPLQEKLASLEQAHSSKEAVNSAKDLFFGNDYVKKYKTEGEDAWERAIEMNDATGGKMTADELKAKALGYFNKTVTRLGVDTSKPLEADKDIDNEGTTDWKAEVERKKAQGLIS